MTDYDIRILLTFAWPVLILFLGVGMLPHKFKQYFRSSFPKFPQSEYFWYAKFYFYFGRLIATFMITYISFFELAQNKVTVLPLFVLQHYFVFFIIAYVAWDRFTMWFWIKRS